MISGRLYELGRVSYFSSRVVKSESSLRRDICKEGFYLQRQLSVVC